MFFSFHLCVYFRCINRDNLSFYIFCSTRAEKEHIQNKRRSRRFSVAFRRTVYVQDEEPPSALHCYPTKPRNMPPNLFIGNGRRYGNVFFNEKLQSCPWSSFLEWSLASFQFFRPGWSGDSPLFSYALLCSN